MEYNARVCNHMYIQHEGEARGLYVLVVTHECIILIQPSLGCINWFVYSPVLASSPGLRGEGKGRPGDEASPVHKYKVIADSV